MKKKEIEKVRNENEGKRKKKEEILDSLEKFFRWLRLKEFFQEEEEEEETDADNLFHPPNSWMPPKRRDATLEIHIKKD